MNGIDNDGGHTCCLICFAYKLLYCYGPNECGCVTKSMPNPLREGGPPCALGLRSRAPTEENPKLGHGSDGISNARVHGMLHVLSKVWEALRRLLKEVQKGAPTEGATALKPHPAPFPENRVMSMYRFNRMGHDQCVATTLREHNDLKDSAKRLPLQIKIIARGLTWPRSEG